MIRQRRLVAGLGIAAAVTILVGAAVGLLALRYQEGGVPYRPEGDEQVPTALRTANRDRLAICVETVDVDISESDARARVDVALIELTRHRRWEELGLAQNVRVDAGWPSPPLAFDRNGVPGNDGREVFGVPSGFVEEASYYRLFVFVVDEGRLVRAFGQDTAITTQEFLGTGGDVFSGVTGGLYVDPDHVDDRGLMITCLGSAFGVWSEQSCYLSAETSPSVTS